MLAGKVTPVIALTPGGNVLQILRFGFVCFVIVFAMLNIARAQAVDIAAAAPETVATPQINSTAPQHRHSAGYDYYATGNTGSGPPALTEAALLLMGGGADVDAAFRWFIAKSGGGHVLILRVSGNDSYHKYLFDELGGISSVETLVFHDRGAASDQHVLEIIAHADGIFIAGGDQANYIRDWKGTPLSAALEQHVRAHKPLGGTSAGLAILGHYSYGALDGGSVESTTALHDPLGSEVTLETDFLHLPLLDNVITDSHFSARKRLGRLIVFVTRLAAQEKKSRIYGIGIDENTALCIEANGNARVYSGSRGRAWLVVPQHAASLLHAGKPLSISDIRIVGLDSHSGLDFKTFAVEQPASSRIGNVSNGEFSQH
ncbi:peptidase [Pseudolysobacter antarcticus]|uniref:Peptidase n=1 Tax=Pseudolysobacter antarcticus TaxID=2511995 RepID=A0A411HH85_9GAMM|nr:cyanophycinase [Pseudolysobacter antarcticus]QBB69784.1 peptidase [Pseudolysobacter antarcticus]